MRAISPGCGVRQRAAGAPRRRSRWPASAVSASASTTTAARTRTPGSRASACVSSCRPRPGPRATARAARPARPAAPGRRARCWRARLRHGSLIASRIRPGHDGLDARRAVATVTSPRRHASRRARRVRRRRSCPGRPPRADGRSRPCAPRAGAAGNVAHVPGLDHERRTTPRATSGAGTPISTTTTRPASSTAGPATRPRLIPRTWSSARRGRPGRVAAHPSAGSPEGTSSATTGRPLD